MIATGQIYKWLEQVKDPEIPTLSLVDLGVITEVSIQDDNNVKIEITPTFVGCPAIDFMKNEIIDVLQKHGIANVTVETTFRKPWSSDRITEKGRAALKQFGLAPPPILNLVTELDFLEHVPCPRCHSSNTQLKNTFGPTLCRSIHYCENCKETFEQFKPL